MTVLCEELTNLWEVVVLHQETFPPEQVKDKRQKILHLIKTKFILSRWLCRWARAAVRVWCSPGGAGAQLAGCDAH